MARTSSRAPTDEFRQDVALLQQPQTDYPSGPSQYVITEHSLGNQAGQALRFKFPYLRPAANRIADWELPEYVEDDNEQVLLAGDGLVASNLLRFNQLYGAAKRRHRAKGVSSLHDIHGKLKDVVSSPLSDSDIRTLLGQSTRIITYPELGTVSDLPARLMQATRRAMTKWI